MSKDGYIILTMTKTRRTNVLPRIKICGFLLTTHRSSVLLSVDHCRFRRKVRSTHLPYPSVGGLTNRHRYFFVTSACSTSLPWSEPRTARSRGRALTHCYTVDVMSPRAHRALTPAATRATFHSMACDMYGVRGLV